MIILMYAFKVIVNNLFYKKFNYDFHGKYKKLIEKLIALSFSYKIFLKIVSKAIQLKVWLTSSIFLIGDLLLF